MDGKVVIVTGASGALGKVVAEVALVRGARVASEIGPARYLAELLGWDDGESAVKLISAILVLTIDPAALLLTLAVWAASPINTVRP